MTTRRLFCLGLLALLGSIPITGCGGGPGGIETGIPENTEPPADFDPGGGATPDMQGTAGKATR